MKKDRNLTEGNITASLWLFALPLMLGNVLQQLYNLVDTWVVGHYIGDRALAAVGSSYTLMTFITSIIIGLCLGTGAFISMAWGAKEEGKIRNGIFLSFVLIGIITLLLMAGLYLCVNPLIRLLQVPEETAGDMKEYLVYVFAGFFLTFLYNYFANILRSIGNSVIPLAFLGVSVVLNIFFDIYLVRDLHMGIRGAAVATVIAQHISGILILLYFLKNYPQYRVRKEDMTWNREGKESPSG